MIYKGVLYILLCWFCLSSIKLFQSYNSQPIQYVIVCQSSLSLKPYVRPSFSYIMSLCDVVIHITCLHWWHFLYEMDIWLKTRSCRKGKAGQSEIGVCKFKLYVVIFHTNFNENRSRTPLQNQLKIILYYIPSFRRQRHSISPSVRQEVVSVQ